MTEDVITQAPAAPERSDLSSVADLPETITLNMRGTRFEVKRERLLSLPESILFGLSSGMNAVPFGENDENESDVMDLDFDPNCFRYILDTIDDADKNVSPLSIINFKAVKPHNRHEHHPYFSHHNDPEEEDADSADSLPWLPDNPNEVPTVLTARPSIIVLREDLEYYVLGDPSLSHEKLCELKDHIGDILTSNADNKHIFNGLRHRDILDSPEYHLMQMLVLVGLTRDQEWAFRERPSRSSRVLSLQMSPVKIPENNTLIEQVHALQKLLLFLRKPAKKCWWDKLQMEGVTVHVRRVWTLELSIFGLVY